MVCISVQYLVKNNDGVGVLIGIRQNLYGSFVSTTSVSFSAAALTTAPAMFGQCAPDNDGLSGYLNYLIIQGCRGKFPPASDKFFTFFGMLHLTVDRKMSRLPTQCRTKIAHVKIGSEVKKNYGIYNIQGLILCFGDF